MAPSFANANIEYLIFAPDLLGRNETDLSDKSMYKLRQTSLARKGIVVKPILNFSVTVRVLGAF